MLYTITPTDMKYETPFSSPRRHDASLLALELVLMNGESMLEKIHLLLHMTGLQSRRHTGAWVSTSIQNVPTVVVYGLVQKRLNPRLGEAPGSRVQRFFLTPNDVLGIRVHVEVFLQLSPREGVELFDASNCSFLEPLFSTVFVKGDVGLARAHDNAVNVFWFLNGLSMLGVWNDPLEVRVTGELLDGRARQWVSQE